MLKHLLRGTTLWVLMSGCPNTQTQCQGPECAPTVPASGNSADYRKFCENTLGATCSLFVGCRIVSTQERCENIFSRGESQCSPKIIEAIDQGRIRFDSARAEACLKELREAGNNCSDALILQERCLDIYVGQVKTGESCQMREECENQGVCVENDTRTCPGVCQPAQGEGSEAYSMGECQRGLVPVNGKCVKPGKVGDACVASSGFATCSDSYCDPTTLKCRALGKAGDACDTQALCGGLFVCGTNGKCVERKRMNEACQGNEECPIDLYCEKPSTGPGKCVERPKLGESCQNKPCTPLDTCHPVNNVCVELRSPLNLPVGATCQFDRECVATAYCDNQVCKARGVLNDACTYNSCQKELYCHYSTQTCQRYAQLNENCEQTSCADGLYCKYRSSAADTCLQEKLLGETCEESSECQGSLRCDSQYKKCTGPTGKDSACVVDSHCIEGLFCLDQKCQAPRSLGGQCSDDRHCASALYCDDATDTCKSRLARGQSCAESNQCLTDFCDPFSDKCAYGMCVSF